MRVFRQQYTDRNGKTKESAKWYVEIRDHHESIKRVPGFTDKTATTELGRKLTRLVSARIAHDPPSAELIRWLEGLPNKLRARIAELGLVDAQSSVTGKTLSQHLEDFEKNLKDRNRTPAYRQLVKTRIQSILDDCGFRQLSDISGVRVERFLAKLKSDGLSQQTINDYLTATKTFLNWMVSNRRLSVNPLAHLSGGNVKSDRRLERRELDEGEIRWLLSTTKKGNVVYGLTGLARFT
ncbi:MAG: site-specific integrase, partial [Schlesneria sp.]